MKALTPEQLKLNDHIPTETILLDIADTQTEINNYQDEKDILMRNPHENKVRIYMLEGRILKRKDFIEKLNQILEYRKMQKSLRE